MIEKPILFTLPNCDKCELTREYLKDTDYGLYPLPKDLKKWLGADKEIVEKYGIMEDIQRTAPILVIPETKEKFVGLLRIKRWVDGNRE